MEDFTFIETGDVEFKPGREVLRLKADGTHWIARDITDAERRKVFADLVRVAAELNKKAQDCKAQHQS